MAITAISPAAAEEVETVASKTAQEKEEIPQNLIYKGGDASTLVAPVPLIDIPTIDFGLLTSPESTSSQELDKLRTALCSWGCFRIINHGMDPEFIEQVRKVGKHFFSLPVEEKKKHSKEIDGNEGYTHHIISSDEKSFEWIDRLYLTVSPEDQRALKYWPENPESFRETLYEYTAKIEKINESLLKAAALTLNLEENRFVDICGDNSTVTAAYNLYPPCPRPDQAIGIRPHADGSTFTYLLQYNRVEGLQILKDNEWYDVSIYPESIFINVGDQLEIMSNGIFKSLVHRVVTNTEVERMSLVLFVFPHPDREIGAGDEVVSEERPRMYRTVKDYLTTLFDYINKGGRTIDVFKKGGRTIDCAKI